MKSFHRYMLVLALALPGAPAAFAQDNAQPAASPAQSLTEGEVRKISKDTGKLTIKHGPIANLDMPAMTMVFQVADPGILDQVKVGDKIRFVADKVDGKFTVMRLDSVQ